MAFFENIFEIAIKKVWYFFVAKLKVYIFSQAAQQHKILEKRYDHYEPILMVSCLKVSLTYSHLFNKRGGWNKQ